MNDQKSLGILIVGLGMGSKRARGLKDARGAHLAAVCDMNAERLTKARDEFGCAAYADLDQALADPGVHCVHVMTPTGFHLDVARKAAAAGKHVIVTKPLEKNAARARELIPTCEEAGVLLGADFELRFNPLYRRVKAALDSGTLGDLLAIDARCKWFRRQEYFFHPRGTWAGDGGGAITIQGIHLIDLIIWLAGMPTEVWADTLTQDHDIEVEDWGFALMRFANPRVRATTTCTTTYAKDLEFGIDLHGTRGAVNTVRGFYDPVPSTGEWYFRPGCEVELPDPGDHPLSAAEDMARAVQSGTKPECNGHEGLKSMLLIDAIYRSSREGRSVQIDV